MGFFVRTFYFVDQFRLIDAIVTSLRFSFFSKERRKKTNKIKIREQTAMCGSCFITLLRT